jgi:nitrogen fixation-related uncharacterized protein
MDSSEEAWKELHGLRENFQELREGVVGLINDKGLGASNTSASTMTINAGGVGVWLAVTACAVSVAVTMVAVVFGALVVSMQSGQISDQKQQIARAQDHLTAIYMMAPHLKPKDQDVNDYHHHAPAEAPESAERQN